MKTVLKEIKCVPIPAVTGKKTTLCFSNDDHEYIVDSEINTCLPKVQRDQRSGDVAVFELTQAADSSTFTQVMMSLGISGDVRKQSYTIRQREYPITLPAIEFMIETVKDVGLNKAGGCANLFPVENSTNNISFFCVERRGLMLFLFVYDLNYDHQWAAGSRFFFFNYWRFLAT